MRSSLVLHPSHSERFLSLMTRQTLLSNLYGLKQLNNGRFPQVLSKFQIYLPLPHPILMAFKFFIMYTKVIVFFWDIPHSRNHHPVTAIRCQGRFTSPTCFYKIFLLLESFSLHKSYFLFLLCSLHHYFDCSKKFESKYSIFSHSRI